MKKLILTSLFFICSAVYAESDTWYPSSQVSRVQQVSSAKVINIRQVNVRSDLSGVGKYTGAGIGAVGALGLAGGSVYGQVVAGIAGAVIGGAIGNEYDKSRASSVAYEMTLQNQNSTMFSIVQPDIDNIKVGDSVYLTTANDGTVRAYKH